jgi:hypothetical protein
MLRKLLLGLFLCLACKNISTGSISADLTAQLLPYDFAQKTPEKIKEILLRAGEEDSEEAAIGRYFATRARLDWFLVAWLNNDDFLFDKLAIHLGLVGCSHQEERERCLKEIPATILKGLKEITVFAPNATPLKNLLSALQLGSGSAALALGVNSASKKNNEIALRARLVVLATAKPTLDILPKLSRTKALETLAFEAPFLCPDNFLALDPKKNATTIDATAAYCGFACPKHRNGVLGGEDTIDTLTKDCSIEYYGFSKGQESFVTKRNFIAYRILQNLMQHLTASREAKQDPLYPLIAKSLDELSPRMKTLRFFASLDLENSIDGLPFNYAASVYLIDSAPYLTLRGSQAFVALWPTLRASEDGIHLAEQQYIHPGKPIDISQGASKLVQELSDAASFDFSLGPRLPQEKFEELLRKPALSLLGAPEGIRARGKPIFLITNPTTTFQEFFDASLTITDAGYGRVRVLTNLSALKRETAVPAIELIFARSEDLVVLEKSPLGFPGGSLILLLQPKGLRVLLPPGLQRSALSPQLRDGVPTEDNSLNSEKLKEFFQYFTATRLIIAASPSITLAQLTPLLDAIKQHNSEAELLLTTAPETESPAWVNKLPKATTGAFTLREPPDPEAELSFDL